MRIFVVFLLFSCVLIANGQVQAPWNEKDRTPEQQAQLDRIKKGIDALFTDKQVPTTKRSWMQPVLLGDGTVDGWRGPMTGEECGAIAAAYAIMGRDRAAISWLNAGRCDDARLLNDFAAAEWYCIHCLISGWADQGFAVMANRKSLDHLEQWIEAHHGPACPPFKH